MKTLSLKTCQALAKAGVTVESEFWWVEGADEFWRVLNFKCSAFSVPAHSLSDLPAVLKELGEIRGWGELMCSTCEGFRVEKNGNYDECAECGLMVDGQYAQVPWLYHFLRCAELFAEGSYPAVDAYLLKLLEV